MKRILVTCLFVASTQLSMTSFAHDEKSASEFGVINMQKLILNVEEGKSARKNLEEEIKKKEQDFLKQKNELDELNKSWQSNAALLSNDAKMKKQKEFQEKFMALRNAEMGFQNEIKQKEQQVTQGIAIKAAQIVNDLAKKKHMKIVFEANSSGLVYVDNPIDLTDEVIKEFKQKSTVISKNETDKKTAKK